MICAAGGVALASTKAVVFQIERALRRQRHHLETHFMRSINQVLRELPSALDAGLPIAAIDESRRRFGGNQLTPLPRESLWRKFLEKFDEPIIKILRSRLWRRRGHSRG